MNFLYLIIHLFPPSVNDNGAKIKKIFLCGIGRRKHGYDDKRIYARNGRIQKKRSGEIFAFSYVLNGRKIHV